MDIGFIGAGKVGCTMGLYLSDQNNIVGYYSKTYASAEYAAQITESKAFDNPLDLCDECEVIFFTTPDGEIANAWSELIDDPSAKYALDGKIVSHASGAISSEVFKGARELGAFAYSTHPLFAIPSKTETAAELHKSFFAVEGAPERMSTVMDLFRSHGNPVQEIPTESKVLYHAAAVMASNHVVALYQLASDQLEACGFDPESAQKAIAPLFFGNAKHIAEDGTLASLTGPAERGDLHTINQHLEVLTGRAREAYGILNEEALEIAKRKHEAGIN